jgi:hypothetical protein
MQLSGWEGIYELATTASQTIYDYLIIGWLGTVWITILICYLGKYAHEKLPKRHHIVESALIYLVSVTLICCIVILQGGNSENWIAMAFGFGFGVFYIDKVSIFDKISESLRG